MEEYEEHSFSRTHTLAGLAAHLRVVVEKMDETNTNKTISLEEDKNGPVVVLYSFDDQSKQWPTKLLHVRHELIPYLPMQVKSPVTKPALFAWIELVIGAQDEGVGMDYSEWEHEAGD